MLTHNSNSHLWSYTFSVSPLCIHMAGNLRKPLARLVTSIKQVWSYHKWSAVWDIARSHKSLQLIRYCDSLNLHGLMRFQTEQYLPPISAGDSSKRPSVALRHQQQYSWAARDIIDDIREQNRLAEPHARWPNFVLETSSERTKQGYIQDLTLARHGHSFHFEALVLPRIMSYPRLSGSEKSLGAFQSPSTVC
jgi:hypothetical protein